MNLEPSSDVPADKQVPGAALPASRVRRSRPGAGPRLAIMSIPSKAYPPILLLTELALLFAIDSILERINTQGLATTWIIFLSATGLVQIIVLWELLWTTLASLSQLESVPIRLRHKIEAMVTKWGGGYAQKIVRAGTFSLAAGASLALAMPAANASQSVSEPDLFWAQTYTEQYEVTELEVDPVATAIATAEDPESVNAGPVVDLPQEGITLQEPDVLPEVTQSAGDPFTPLTESPPVSDAPPETALPKVALPPLVAKTTAGSQAKTISTLPAISPPHSINGLKLTSSPSPQAPDTNNLAPSRIAPTTTEVKPGDSLWSIAANILGPGKSDQEITEYWQSLYRLNQMTIGSDPGQIIPGMTLQNPTS